MSTQSRQFYGMGFAPANPLNATAGQFIDGSSCWAVAFGFLPHANATVSSVRFNCPYINSPTGPFTIAIYSSTSAGLPSTSLGSVALPTVMGNVTATGLAVPVLGGHAYWAVISCPGTSTGAAPMVLVAGDNTGPAPGFGSSYFGWNTTLAINGTLTSWGPVTRSSAICRIGYNGDTVFDGMPVSQIANDDPVSGSKETGVKFTVPAGAAWNITGCWFLINTITGSPTAGLRAKLYTGAATPAAPSSYAALSTVLDINLLAGGGWFRFNFSAPVAVVPGTVCRLTWGEDTNSDTGNKYQGVFYAWDSEPASLALLPLGGTACLTRYDGGGWTDYADAVIPFLVLLDNTAPFASSGGGGGGATAEEIAAAVWADPTGAAVATNADAPISSRSVYAGGTVASVTAPVTVGTITDKAGYNLAPSGLDLISTTPPPGVATTFPGMLIQLWRRFHKKSTLTTTQLLTYADDGTTVLTTQAATDDGTTQTLGPAS